MEDTRSSAWHRLREGLRGPLGRSLVGGLAILAVLLTAWWQAVQWYEALLVSEYKAQSAVRASLRGNALSLAIERRFALLQGLHAYVQTEAGRPDFGDRFQVFAAQLYRTPSARGIRNLAVAPDGVVRYVYPIDGNENVIGYSPLDDPRPQVRQDAERAIVTGETILSGPSELVQGGLGLIARQAVYLPAQAGQGETFWGLVNVAIDLHALIDEVDLDGHTGTTLDFALRDGAGLVFYGDAALFGRDPVIHVIALPEGVWELAGVPDGGWHAAIQRPLWIFGISGLSIAVLAAVLTFTSIRRQAELALAVARQKAITEENVHLYERSRRLAVLEERQRIARELHDSVSQALYGIGLGARTARALLDRDPVKAIQPVEYVLSLAEAGLAEMRALIFELRPDSLEREGLVSALAKQAAALRARHGLEVETVFDAEPALPFEAQEALYRVAQEALNNVVKHAHAGQVTIRLESRDEQTVLAVRDNGIGFDPRVEYAGHVGLHTMRERVERLGGVLDIESVPGQGTHLTAMLPKQAANWARPGR